MSSSSAMIGALRVDLGIETAQFTKGLEEAKKGVQEFVERLKAAAEAAIAALALEKISEGFLKINENLDALGKSSQKIGIPVDQLAKLKYAAELADVPFENLQTSIEKFSKGLSEALSTGKGGVADGLKAIGVSATDVNGKVKPQIQLFEEIAQKFAGYRDGANKTALAMLLFGKAGAELIPLLNQGKRGIQEAADQLMSFGGVPSERAIKAAEELLDNFKRIKEAFYAVAQQVVIAVTPAIRDLTTGIVDFLGAGGNAKRVADTIVEGLKKLAEIAVQIFYDFEKFGESVSYWWDRFANGKEFNQATWDAHKKAIADVNMQMDAAIEKIKEFKAADDGSGEREGGVRTKKLKDAPAVASGMFDAQNRAKTLVEQHRKEIDKFIESLKIQNEQFTKSSLQMKIDEALHRAGKDATSSQTAAIKELITKNQIYMVQQQTAIQLAKNAEDHRKAMFDDLNQIAESGLNAMNEWIDGAKSLGDVLNDLLKQLAQAAVQAALLGKGSLASFMGTDTGGGLLGGIFKALSGFGGLYANGGQIPAGQWGIVGEGGGMQHAEVVAGPATVIPVSQLSGGGMQVNVNNYSSPDVSVSTRQNRSGGLDLDVIMTRKVNETISSGAADGALGLRTGLRPLPVRR